MTEIQRGIAGLGGDGLQGLEDRHNGGVVNVLMMIVMVEPPDEVAGMEVEMQKGNGPDLNLAGGDRVVQGPVDSRGKELGNVGVEGMQAQLRIGCNGM